MLAKTLSAATAAAAVEKLYVEDVFSTWLYTGNGSTQTITNGIDLSGEGGLVWTKERIGPNNHLLYDTNRGTGKYVSSNTSTAEITNATTLTSFNSDGFSLGVNASYNGNGTTYASWTFRKAEKFFDVVTYTGTGSTQDIPHNLGSVPGMYICKSVSSTGDWNVYHRGLSGANYYIQLNSTAPQVVTGSIWNSAAPTATEFYVGNNNLANTAGVTYVAYLFAHDAGGFGDSGGESVVKCGSYTGNGAADGQAIDLGWEPQWLMIKGSSVSSNWQIIDTMRGATVATGATGGTRPLRADLSNAEYQGDLGYPYATGFVAGPSTNTNNSGSTYIYIAIRRGPMKTPTDATEVFGLSARTGTGADATVTGGQIADLAVIKNRGALVTSSPMWSARMTGAQYLTSTSNNAEVAAATTILQSNSWDVMNGIKVGTTSTLANASSNTFINYLFRRAPGFFDLVCYTGTGVARTVSHNLQVAPELLIIKSRTTTDFWPVYYGDNTKSLGLSSPALPASGVTRWNSTSPTSSVFSLGADVDVNSNNLTYIAYMFATLAGVSKIGTYVGTGAALQIDCGFTAGARFVLVKRISGGTGGWTARDTARGIVSGNDPYFFFNSTSAETTTADFMDPYSAGFELSNDASNTININGSSYLYFSVA